MTDQKIKVLYIAGWGRSGSTILANILGEVNGFFSVGELFYIWERGIIENRPCGSGEPFHDCKLWQDVMDKAFGGMDKVDAEQMRKDTQKIRTRHFIYSLTAGGKKEIEARVPSYRDHLRRIYDAVQEQTGSRVIVDSSKFPMFGYIVGTLPNIDLYVLHLVRDPRATAYSWLRLKKDRKTGDDKAVMAQHNPFQSTIWGNAMNMATETALQRITPHYMRLRYEDFVAAPKTVSESILKFIGEDPEGLPFTSENEVELTTSYTISGNPIRFNKGAVKLKIDDEWKSKMKPRDRALVTGLAWPWLLRYGYLRDTRKE